MVSKAFRVVVVSQLELGFGISDVFCCFLSILFDGGQVDNFFSAALTRGWAFGLYLAVATDGWIIHFLCEDFVIMVFYYSLHVFRATIADLYRLPVKNFVKGVVY